MIYNLEEVYLADVIMGPDQMQTGRQSNRQVNREINPYRNGTVL